MMDWLIPIGILLAAFLCGSIPTGYWVVKAVKGIDIRTVGSGNIGSTNVRRIAGAKAALLTQVIDVPKGAIPVGAAILLSRTLTLPVSADVLAPTTGLAAILGHDFSPFLAFRGGKGVNTTVGAFLVIATVPTVIAIGIYFGLRLATRIVSTGSLALGLALPCAVAAFRLPLPILLASATAGVLIIIRHRTNINRLIRGEERPVED